MQRVWNAKVCIIWNINIIVTTFTERVTSFFLLKGQTQSHLTALITMQTVKNVNLEYPNKLRQTTDFP